MIANVAADSTPLPARLYLVRIGLYGEPLQCQARDRQIYARRQQVVVETERGEILAEILREMPSDHETDGQQHSCILRAFGPEDKEQSAALQARSADDYSEWRQRIEDWNMPLELVDLEWTLDGKRLMLYVLNERGPETTKLALRAAAEGFPHVDVLPVSAEGLQATSADGGGCGCGSNGGCHK